MGAGRIVTEPDARRAIITSVALTYACPACEVQVDSFIEAKEGDNGFEIALHDRFDLCSHCGQLLDFGAMLTQVAA